MPASKIVNESELLRWFEEGRTYRWMVEEYLRKYNLQVSISMFSNFRRRRGLDTRTVRDGDLMPWAVSEEHRWDYSAQMLRYEGRRRADQPVDPEWRHKLKVWKANLRKEGKVIGYDPEHGFVRLRRAPSDTDIIRRPERVTGRGLQGQESPGG